ncbi:MAG: acyl-CoA desaturase [Planctomycetes bacterium]|nr:acyl-CoA desaturase [Planctomycetota bacterium]
MSSPPAGVAPAAPQAFSEDLRRRVAAYAAPYGGELRGGAAYLLKSALLLLAFLVAGALVLSGRFSGWATLGLAGLWGVASALVAFNVPHDALHGAASTRPGVNRALSWAFDLIGMHATTWWIKHNLAHHGYANQEGLDPDLDAGPLLRLAPGQRRYWFHRYQLLYAPLVYASLSLFMVFALDLRVLGPKAFAARYGVDVGWRQRLACALSKALYLGYALALPLWLLPFEPWRIVAGFVGVHAVIGLASAAVLLPAHLVEGTAFPTPEEARADPWRTQLAVTWDFAPESRLANFFLGGFNTNAFHHLFPRVCHLHYRPLTRILRETAAEHGVPYHALSLPAAVAAHARFLVAMGRPPEPA